MKEYSNTEILTAEEERKLILDGSPQAKERVIEGILRYTMQIARQYAGNNEMKFEDYCQQGVIGLLKAYNNFDTSKDVRLSTYADPWIRAEIMDFVFSNEKITKVVTKKIDKKIYYRMRKLPEHFTHKDIIALAEECGATVEQTVEVVMGLKCITSYFNAAHEDDPYGYEYYLPSLDPSPENILETEEIKARQKFIFNEEFKNMNERWKDILSSRYLVEKPETLEKLSDKYGVSKERVRQIEKKSIDKIKAGVAQW